MPTSLEILLLVAAFILFLFIALFAGGWGVRRMCFKIIAELEEARAFKESRAVAMQDERKNIFRVGTGNIRPKAVKLLLADGLIIRTATGKYYLDKEKLAEARSKLKAEEK